MKPYFEEDGITIYHGDCREVIPFVKEGWYDAIIADPPYGTLKYETDIFTLSTNLLDCFIRAARSVCVFGYPEDLVSLCVASKKTPAEWVTWFPTNKACAATPSRLPRSSEHIAIFGEVIGANRIFRNRSQHKFSLRITLGRGLSIEEARDDDVWRDASPGMAFNHELRQHPNEKPLSVLKKLVLMLSDENEIVCDPFMGSGTTLRAAKDLGRRAIGIEIEEKYCEIAAKRLSQKVFQW